MAIFVEGQTELLFVERLIGLIARTEEVKIIKVEAHGGARGARIWREIELYEPTSDETKQILIANCSTDNRVVSDMRDQAEGLVEAGFEVIVGLRDARPELERGEIAEAKSMIREILEATPGKPKLIIAIMEIEAWFLAEYTHFPRIHEMLTTELISSRLGFDPAHDDMELRDKPADDLDNAYTLVGCRYKKRRDRVERTLDALDLVNFKKNAESTCNSFHELAACVDNFLSKKLT